MIIRNQKCVSFVHSIDEALFYNVSQNDMDFKVEILMNISVLNDVAMTLDRTLKGFSKVNLQKHF